MDSSLLPFFHPTGVAVIGASTSPEKLGHGVARNLLASGYSGAVHFVGRGGGTLFGQPLYADIDRVPDPVDLAVIIVPPQATPEVLSGCAARGIRAAIIAASGFREAGPDGVALEARCLEIARGHGMRLLGPNCIGIIDTYLPLDTTFLQSALPSPGHIGFVSHSGAFCAAMIDWARGEGFGFSQIISLGNQADVNETDVLAGVGRDEHTRVIVLYMEGVSDGRRFVRVAAEVARDRPVIALKVGRSEPGQRAAASHTGALAGSESAFDAAFERAGVLRADGAEQVFDWARALANCSLPEGNRVAILTDAGGPGVIAVDALFANGLDLATLAAATVDEIRSLLPPAASPVNPVDMLASASPEQYAACLHLLLADPGVDSVLVILPAPPMFTAESVAEALISEIRASVKPVVVALMGSVLTAQAAEAFRRAAVPTYPFPERAASALGALVRRAEYLAGLPTEQSSDAGSRQAENQLGLPSNHPVTVLAPEELLSAYGIQTIPLMLATSADEAASLAARIGFPVVMKIASPDIPHKSDVDGVWLGVESERACHDAYTQLVDHARAARPGARIEGVHLQPQITSGQDVILGAVLDPQFGPLVMFGSGGVEVEGLRDVAFALAPLSPSEAERLISRTWAGRKLRGYRSLPAVDAGAVRDALVQISRLAMEHPEIEEVEINPLRVLADGAIAVDVRVTRARQLHK
jgi:acetyltransferase